MESSERVPMKKNEVKLEKDGFAKESPRRELFISSQYISSQKRTFHCVMRAIVVSALHFILIYLR